LGLPVFRFYDIDNAEATTLTGQDLIKFSKTMTNHYYNKELGTGDENYVIYIDTDSLFLSAVPLVKHRHPNIDTSAEATMTQHILNISGEIQEYLNNSYDLFAKRFLNLDNHHFEIKQEVVAKSALFIVKKRYGMRIINDSGRTVNEINVKGLDTVRSSFATAMKKLLSEVLDDILANVPKDKIDQRIFKFKKSMKALDIDDISSPTGVKKIGKFISKINVNKFSGSSDNVGGKLISTYYKKATPVHVKASISYNDMLSYYGERRYSEIANGDKIKWVYLKQNPLNLSVLAYRGYDDPPKIVDYIKKYIDVDKMYKQALSKKIDMFYSSMGWNPPVDARYTMERFF
jgi:DNA polymerase elongation subunit (family B)